MGVGPQITQTGGGVALPMYKETQTPPRAALAGLFLLEKKIYRPTLISDSSSAVRLKRFCVYCLSS
jgi:hypothetical protein